MAKCAIDSDATIGFNLPLIDPKKPDNGNFFVAIMNQFKNENVSSKEIENVLKQEGIDKTAVSKKLKVDDESKISSKLIKDFRQNMNTLFDEILKKAEELKNNSEKI